MLKIRMQGTLGDLRWFRRLLEAFANKGTKRFFRMYAEV